MVTNIIEIPVRVIVKGISIGYEWAILYIPFFLFGVFGPSHCSRGDAFLRFLHFLVLYLPRSQIPHPLLKPEHFAEIRLIQKKQKCNLYVKSKRFTCMFKKHLSKLPEDWKNKTQVSMKLPDFCLTPTPYLCFQNFSPHHQNHPRLLWSQSCLKILHLTALRQTLATKTQLPGHQGLF